MRTMLIIFGILLAIAVCEVVLGLIYLAYQEQKRQEQKAGE